MKGIHNPSGLSATRMRLLELNVLLLFSFEGAVNLSDINDDLLLIGVIHILPCGLGLPLTDLCFLWLAIALALGLFDVKDVVLVAGGVELNVPHVSDLDVCRYFLSCGGLICLSDDLSCLSLGTLLLRRRTLRLSLYALLSIRTTFLSVCKLLPSLPLRNLPIRLDMLFCRRGFFLFDGGGLLVGTDKLVGNFL